MMLLAIRQSNGFAIAVDDVVDDDADDDWVEEQECSRAVDWYYDMVQ